MGYIIPSASYVGGHGFQIWQTAVCTVQNVQVILCSMIDRLYPAIDVLSVYIQCITGILQRFIISI